MVGFAQGDCPDDEKAKSKKKHAKGETLPILIWCEKCNGHYHAAIENTWIYQGKLMSKCNDCNTIYEAIIHINWNEKSKMKK